MDSTFQRWQLSVVHPPSPTSYTKMRSALLHTDILMVWTPALDLQDLYFCEVEFHLSLTGWCTELLRLYAHLQTHS